MKYQIYSVYGRLLHETDELEVALRGLREWPLAWTLVGDGKVLDLNTSPSREPGHESFRI